MVAHQRPKLAARELTGVHKRATVQVRECIREPEMSLGEKPKTSFAATSMLLTRSRHFSVPRNIILRQRLVSRSLVMVLSLGCIKFWLGAGPCGHPKAAQKKL